MRCLSIEKQILPQSRVDSSMHHENPVHRVLGRPQSVFFKEQNVRQGGDAATRNRYRLRFREAVRGPSAKRAFARFGQDDGKRFGTGTVLRWREAVRGPSAPVASLPSVRMTEGSRPLAMMTDPDGRFARFGQNDGDWMRWLGTGGGFAVRGCVVNDGETGRWRALRNLRLRARDGCGRG